MRVSIIYHMYAGVCASQVWASHKPILEKYIELNPLSKLNVYVYGDIYLGICSNNRIDYIYVKSSTLGINEFDTLEKLEKLAYDCDVIVYMHSKGSSGGFLKKNIREWSLFLVESTLNISKNFQQITDYGFNVAGVNYALGIFEHYQEPKKHFSGNFWVAQSSYITTLPSVKLGTAYTKVRHNAEYWISESKKFNPCNFASIGLDFYNTRLDLFEYKLKAINYSSLSESVVAIYREACEFRFSTYLETVCKCRLLAYVSEFTYNLIPRNATFIKRVHNSIFLRLGSRKSKYIYMPSIFDSV